MSLLFATSAAQAESGSSAPSAPSATATLEQCTTAVNQVNRSATFSGAMVASVDTQRMAMRIEVQERTPETRFHTVDAPGLGVWRSSNSGVGVYKYLKQVTNMSAPAVYRGLVSFRWLDDRGHVIKHIELHTHGCDQPAQATAPVLLTPAGTSSSLE